MQVSSHCGIEAVSGTGAAVDENLRAFWGDDIVMLGQVFCYLDADDLV